MCLVAASAVSGCGSGVTLYPVQGKVQFEDGSPVRQGVVEFQSIDGNHAARGTITPEGTFTLTTDPHGDGAVAGKHRVVVVQLATGPIMLEDPAQPGADSHAGAGTHGLLKQRVDPAFSSFDTSTLEVTVEAGPNNQPTLVVKAARDF